MWLRRRLLLRLARRLVHSSYRGSRAICRLHGRSARVELRASVFCTVREKVEHPLCGFYSAAFTRMLTLFEIGASTEVIACRGAGGPTCVLTVSLADSQSAPPPVEAL